MNKLLNVSSSPHVRSGVTTKNIMYDVAIAMIPATVWGVMQFGLYSLLVVAATVLSCVLSEYVFEVLMKKPVTISDGSALVTGMILGLNMPPSIPIWMPVLGGVFSIIVVKQLYGGLGQNFMNPALAGRCFLLISLPSVKFLSWTCLIFFKSPLVAVQQCGRSSSIASLWFVFQLCEEASTGAPSEALRLVPQSSRGSPQLRHDACRSAAHSWCVVLSLLTIARPFFLIIY